MTQYEKNRILADFADGLINVVCTVDIFNEGIDVPDVNILVFQRVTHSRRIFIQQLGRGLRISDNKEKVIVLDFVSDIRRFAAGLELKDGLDTKKFVESLKVILLAESLGGIESLIEVPAVMTHGSIPREIRLENGIKDELIRLSVGIEDEEDLINDLKQALDKIG